MISWSVSVASIPERSYISVYIYTCHYMSIYIDSLAGFWGNLQAAPILPMVFFIIVSGDGILERNPWWTPRQWTTALCCWRSWAADGNDWCFNEISMRLAPFFPKLFGSSTIRNWAFLGHWPLWRDVVLTVAQWAHPVLQPADLPATQWRAVRLFSVDVKRHFPFGDDEYFKIFQEMRQKHRPVFPSKISGYIWTAISQAVPFCCLISSGGGVFQLLWIAYSGVWKRWTNC